MSIFSQIIEGLANLDEGYARDSRQSKREEKAANRQDKSQEARDARQDQYQTARDERTHRMTLARDQMLAAEQAVRDARLHGNSMDVQKAQIDADRARYEYQNAQESIRQDKDIGFKREDNKEQRRFLSTEANKERDTMVGEKAKDRDLTTGESAKDRTFRSIEAGLQRGFLGGESEKDRGHARGMAQEDRTWRTGEREAGQKYGTSEREAGQTYGTSEREATQTWRTGERKGGEKFQGRESKKDRRNRLKSIEATAKANVRSEDEIAGNRERRASRKLASVFPDGMNPAERETAVRDMERTLSYDLPLAEARGRIKTIDDTEGGALFPGYYGYRSKDRPKGSGNPFGTTPDAGNTGINIKDLYE